MKWIPFASLVASFFVLGQAILFAMLIGIIIWSLCSILVLNLMLGETVFRDGSYFGSLETLLITGMMTLLGPLGVIVIFVCCVITHDWKFHNGIYLFWKKWRYDHPTDGELMLRKFES